MILCVKCSLIMDVEDSDTVDEEEDEDVEDGDLLQDSDDEDDGP